MEAAKSPLKAVPASIRHRLDLDQGRRFSECENVIAMKAIRPRQVFLQWTSRLALAAMLALVALPTIGRLYAGSFGTAVAGSGGTVAVVAVEMARPAPLDHAAHAASQTHAADHRSAPAPAGNHSGHGDCPYCPLQGQLADAAHPLPLLATVPAGPAPSLAIADGHATLRPHGLHARGPPTPA